jgi:hypothetical protein
MRTLILLAYVGLAACSVSPVGAGNPGGAGGSGGVGGSGGTGGEGGGGSGGSGGGCVCGAGPVLHVVPEDSTGYWAVAGRVSDHRAIASQEVPEGVSGVDRVLAIRLTGSSYQVRLYYAVPDPALEPQVRVGDEVEFEYEAYEPFGRSAGVELRANGELVWAAEQGDFGHLGTGAPELSLVGGDVVCQEASTCGIRRYHRVTANLPYRPPVSVAPGETVNLRLGDRVGPFYLAEWVSFREERCDDMPTGISRYVFSLPLPGRCGPALGRECPEGQLCEFVGYGCGEDGEVGTCVDRPGACIEGTPVCGCDGRVYGGECYARSAGTDVGYGCEIPEDSFRCGPYFCNTFLDYCRVIVSDVAGISDAFVCVPLPDACQAMDVPTCSCLREEPCGDNCSGMFPDLTVTCSGG